MNLPTELFNNPKFLSNHDVPWLYAILIVNSDENGVVEIKQRSFAREIGISYQTLRTLLDKLESTQLITQSATQYLTQITICQSVQKRKPVTQSKTQQLTQLTTQSESLLIPEVKGSNEIDFDSFMRFFNESVSTTAIPTIRVMTDKRKKLLRVRLKDFDKRTLMLVIQRAVASDFLTGRKTDWKADFDWIFKQDNFIRILEGKYDNRTNQATNQSSGRGQHGNPSIDEIAAAVYQRTCAGENYR